MLSAAWWAPSQNLFAGDWPQWRGPSLNGSSQDTDLPTTLSISGNLRWSVPLPGEGASTPVIVGNHVFLTSTDSSKNALIALCIDAANGEILWEKNRPTSSTYSIPYSCIAAPSAVADQNQALFAFGTGLLLACDHAGDILWERDLEREYGPLSLEHYYSASPLLYKNRIYLAVLRNDKISFFQKELGYNRTENLASFILCLDWRNGENIWRQVRKSEADGVENRESYATPIVMESDSGALVFSIGANYLTGHDWETGAEKLRMNYKLNDAVHRRRVVPTPVLTDQWIIAVKPRYGALFALDRDSLGELPYSSIQWEHAQYTPDTPSPLYYRDGIYILNDQKGILTRLNTETGAAAWSGKVGNNLFHASPTGGDGKIYCINLRGEVTVLEAGPAFKILSKTKLGGQPCMSSIAIANQCLYIRTSDTLYCFCDVSEK
ncbi:PQQ-binding-like beta-propeller repeat protein [Candidatus Sumerlaeota bacterium]|nr:PQQ-binding-like beta-propeller repeat protein [Candidatus Sumerlaeota bacterium]